MRVRVDEVLERVGGIATRADLVRATSRADVDRALRTGELATVGYGRYALASVGDAVVAAHRISGVLSLASAALHHGWEVKTVPDKPHVAVPRNRKVPQRVRAEVHVHHADLLPEQVLDGIVTTHEVTLEQCLRQLPEDEGLAIADSALRHGVAPATLARVTMTVRGAGAAKVRRVVGAARADAANPFESVLRSIARSVPGLRVEPQRLIPLDSGWVRPDLVDHDLGIVLEADSFEWHGDRAALARDARRYNRLVAAGWLVLRFSWEDVMLRADDVRSVLVDAVAVVARRAEVACPRCGAS